MSRVRFPIHQTFGPLATGGQVRQAFLLQFEPWKWWEGREREQFRRELSRSFGMSASLFASGRDALRAALRTLTLKTGEEVIVQGFTCVAVPNAIHAGGGTVVYSDIDPQTLNLDPEKVQRVITPRTRAVICQHTFGIPADTARLRSICDKRGLLLIEDCAHVVPDASTSLSTSAGGERQLSLLHTASVASGVGVQGDVLIFSFGRDKAVSGVTGGAVLTRHPVLAHALEDAEKRACSLSAWHIINLLGYPLRYEFAKRVWGMPLPLSAGANLAKAYLRWARFLRLLPPVYARGEKEGKVGLDLYQLPNACAALALAQLGSLDTLNDHRGKLGAFYERRAREHGWNFPGGVTKAPALLKFPLYTRNPDRIRDSLKREQIYLDDGWHGAVVNPRDTDQAAAGYTAGSCPRAEEVSRHILTLPTHPTMTEEQARYLVHALRSYVR